MVDTILLERARRIAAMCCTRAMCDEGAKEIYRALVEAKQEGFGTGLSKASSASPKIRKIHSKFHLRGSKFPPALESVDWSGVLKASNSE